MRGILIGLLAAAMLVVALPEQVKADCGPRGCGVFGGRIGHGAVVRRAGGFLKRLAGVERRQARRAARRG